MVSLQYIRTLPNGDSISTMMRDAGLLLFGKQMMVLDNAFKTKTGDTERWLGDRSHINVTATSDGAQLVIDYPSYFHFLDLKYSRYGKKKQTYAPIYNKYVFGFLMGYLYNNIRREMMGEVYNSWQKGLTDLTIDIL
jgi:hypothetical protein